MSRTIPALAAVAALVSACGNAGSSHTAASTQTLGPAVTITDSRGSRFKVRASKPTFSPQRPHEFATGVKIASSGEGWIKVNLQLTNLENRPALITNSTPRWVLALPAKDMVTLKGVSCDSHQPVQKGMCVVAEGGSSSLTVAVFSLSGEFLGSGKTLDVPADKSVQTTVYFRPVFGGTLSLSGRFPSTTPLSAVHLYQYYQASGIAQPLKYSPVYQIRLP